MWSISGLPTPPKATNKTCAAQHVRQLVCLSSTEWCINRTGQSFSGAFLHRETATPMSHASCCCATVVACWFFRTCLCRDGSPRHSDQTRPHRLGPWPLLKPEDALNSGLARPFVPGPVSNEGAAISDASMHAARLWMSCNAEAAMRVIEQQSAWE